MQTAKINSRPTKKETGKTKIKPRINRQTKSKVVEKKNLLKDGRFEDKLKYWNYWQAASKHTNLIEEIHKGIRIFNPNAQLVGLKQNVQVVSGQVYRLKGSVRSAATDNPKIIFGGRVGFYIPGQKEKQIVWMSEFNQWWPKQLIFTNQVTGTATVYFHMGYGNVASTGEFSNIRLEKVE